MAVTAKTFLDYAGLQHYNGKIKAYIDAADVTKIDLNKASVTIGTAPDTVTYAAGNLLLVWIGNDDTTSEAAASYKIPMESQALQAEIDAIKTAIENLVTSVGLLGNLKSAVKTDLVAGINDVIAKGGFVNASGVLEIPATYSVAAATNGGAATSRSIFTVKDYIDAAHDDAANKVAAAIDSLDTATDVVLASVEDNVVTLTKAVKEEDGIIAPVTGSNSSISLSEVAYTGAAADVSTAAIDDGDATDPVQLYAAGTVQGVLEGLARDLNDLGVESAVTVEKLTTASTGAISSYVVKQNGVQVGSTIDIPKDYLVKAANVETVATANTPYTGAAVGDKYIDFIINTRDDVSGTGEHLYVAINDLIHPISAAANAEEIQLAVSATNEISGSVVEISADKISYDNTAESVQDALERLDGADTVTGSVAKAVKDAVEALDTANDVALAVATTSGSGTSAATVITLTGAMSEADGIIAGESADNVTLTTITEAEIDALFV